MAKKTSKVNKTNNKDKNKKTVKIKKAFLKISKLN